MGGYVIHASAIARLGSAPSIDGEVHDVATDILDDARATVLSRSYETGHLYESGFVDGGASDYRVGFDTPYAHFVEFGTSEMNAEPYLTPAAVRYRGRR